MSTIKRLAAFDFDGTLIDSPEKEWGKAEWQKRTGEPYPHEGWWGRPESLSLDVFDIKPFPRVLKELEKELATPNTYVIILTSRLEKLRPQVQAVLDANNINVHKLDMKKDNRSKGQRILQYVEEFPDLIEINAYDDRDTDITAFDSIRDQLPEQIQFNVYLANQGALTLTETTNSILNIIQDEIKKIV